MSLFVFFFVFVFFFLFALSYDNPSALSAQLKQYFQDTKYGGDHWQTYFGLLYSVYSFPNVILPFLGGFFVDFFGVRIMLIIFSSFILGGQALFALGGAMKSIPVRLDDAIFCLLDSACRAPFPFSHFHIFFFFRFR